MMARTPRREAPRYPRHPCWNLPQPCGLGKQAVEVHVKRIAGLIAGLLCGAVLAACASGVTPYEGLLGQQVRGMPKEEPAPPAPDLPGGEKPLDSGT